MEQRFWGSNAEGITTDANPGNDEKYENGQHDDISAPAMRSRNIKPFLLLFFENFVTLSFWVKISRCMITAASPGHHDFGGGY